MAEPNVQAQVQSLLDQAKALVLTIQARTAAEQSLNPAKTFIRAAANELSTIREAGESATLRQAIYQLVQSQKGDGNCAFYKELKCPIHIDTLGENGPPTTLLCGHTYCTGCITPIIQKPNVDHRRCPECRSPITLRVDQLKENVCINNILAKIMPMAGGRRRTARVSRAVCYNKTIRVTPLYKRIKVT